jgi:pseudomonalisin
VKKFVAFAVAAGLAAGCSGHAGNSALPNSATGQTQGGAGINTQAITMSAAPTGFAPTATKAFALKNAIDTGAASASTPLTVRLGLQIRNMTSLQSAVAHGTAVSDAAFAATYAPTSAQVTSVRNYLASKGFGNIVVEPNNLLVSATGTVAQVQSAFATTIHNFTVNGKPFHANTGPAYVPTPLSGIVIAVLGLNNAPIVNVGPKVTPCTGGVSNPCIRFYDPNTFRTAYHASDDDGPISDTPGGDTDDTAYNTTIGIMAEGNLATSISDFRYNEKAFNVPQASIVVKQVGLASPDTSGSDEWTLDMTYSSGIAGRVRTLYVYDTTSLTDSDIALEYSHWVTDNLAKIGNSSFGECELFPYLDGSMLVDDMLFLEGASHGQTMFASTGDTGGFCSVGVPPNGVPGGAPFVEYPAASPYVVAVGGTDLFTNANGTYKGETAWEAGGGGVSQFEYSPYWEAEAQPIAAQGQNFRGTPDVSMDASLETGALLYLGGSEYITGGTSLASPLAAGSYAIMQTQHSNTLGFGPPRFYKNYAQHPTATTLTGPPPTQAVGGFHDIIVGSNANPIGTATPRYDYATGLGSFDVLLLNSQIGAATP